MRQNTKTRLRIFFPLFLLSSLSFTLLMSGGCRDYAKEQQAGNETCTKEFLANRHIAYSHLQVLLPNNPDGLEARYYSIFNSNKKDIQKIITDKYLYLKKLDRDYTTKVFEERGWSIRKDLSSSVFNYNKQSVLVFSSQSPQELNGNLLVVWWDTQTNQVCLEVANLL